VLALLAAFPSVARSSERAGGLVDAREAAAPAPPPSAGGRTLGRRAAVSIDPVTGTIRALQARAGALSAVTAGDRAAVARRWVREHRAALGLTAADLDGLALAGRTVSAATGITHLRYRQADRGIPAFDGGLRVSLDRGGRVLSVTGAPVPDLEAEQAAPRLDAVAALRALQRDVGARRAVEVVAGPAGVRRETRFAGGGLARLVVFDGRLGWHVTDAGRDAVVDAGSGAILFRHDLTRHALHALVFDSHPGGPVHDEDLVARGWLPQTASDLRGPYAHVYSDTDGNDRPRPEEEIPKGSDEFHYPFIEFGSCAPVQCSWEGGTSWRTNRRQNGVQAFYLVNRFRDHLAAPPIGFTAFSGDRAVIVETNDPASDDNASMTTPPTGSPRLQLGRFSGPAFRFVNAGDSAAIVWHEYAHGLSSRLVTYADGSSALSTPHAAAMGEGWSDWYALDLLGATDLGHYTDATPHTLRTQPIDCSCGYTFADLGRIAAGPDPHADGEIWGQTLWDLRRRVGSYTARALITEGMRMSPPEPSFLDMRNAILAAAVGLGVDRAVVWDAFRRRGMGYFAHAEDAGDMTPREDYSPPPAPSAPNGRTTGTVTSADTGLPLRGVAVGFEGLGTTTGTAATGAYALDAPAGTYPELAFEAAGYERVAIPGFAVRPRATRVQDVALRRNWASRAGGAAVTAVSDAGGAPFGCGPAQLIDQRDDTAWSAFNTRPSIVVRLPAAIDVSAFRIDPTSACGNPPGASTADYRIEVSGDGRAFAPAAEGTFGAAHRGRRTVVPATARGVRYVRLTLLSAQSAGSRFVDVSELEVLGAPPNRLPAGSLAVSRVRVRWGAAVEFAASFADPDSRITGYDWDFDGDGDVDRSTAGPSTSYAYRRAGRFDATVRVRDFRGGAGTASRRLTVARPRRPRLELPRRGSHGRLAFRVTCAQRCTVIGTLEVGGRSVRRLRRTVASDRRRRFAVRLPRPVRRAARRRDAAGVRVVLTVSARYAGGGRTNARRAVEVAL
jgi:extracellular elastinolytic metalloproteinase